jgi:hypothetical protein
MTNQEITDWTARAVAQAILVSGKSKLAVSDATDIPRTSLHRKLKGTGEFTMSELYRIAVFIGVHPHTFEPPVFRNDATRLAVAA